jgi:hypothetical protein
MDEQPDVLSFGTPREPGRWSSLGRGWTGPGRGGRVTVVVLGVLVVSLGVAAYLALLVTHRDATIGNLRAELRSAQAQASASAQAAGTVTATAPALPVEAGSTVSSFPNPAGGSFSVVAAAIRPRPGAAPLTWLFLYGQHARPGQRYGLLEGTCGGQYVTASDLADGTAGPNGDLTIVAPNVDISATASDVWVLVYRLQDGVTLGGVKGPLLGGGAHAFRTTPPCS